jgi:hypothetical protein
VLDKLDIKTIVRCLEFNPYHDSAGRFAVGDSVTLDEKPGEIHKVTGQIGGRGTPQHDRYIVKHGDGTRTIVHSNYPGLKKDKERS